MGKPVIKTNGIRGPQGPTGPRGPAGTGSGTVISVVAGTNVSVDSTDPAHPVVSATGGGGVDTSTIHAATSKTTPVDADEMLLLDSAASFGLKKLTWANLKAAIASYIASATQVFTNKDLSSGTNIFPSGIYKAGGSDVAIADGGTGTSSLPTGLLVGAGTGAITGKTAPSGAVVGDTDAQTLSAKRINPRVVAMTDAATITPAGDTTDIGTVTIAGNRTIAAPSGTPVDGQLLILRITQDATGSRTLTWNSIYSFPDGAPTLSTPAASIDGLSFRYYSAISKWVLQAFSSATGLKAQILTLFPGLMQGVFYTTAWPSYADYSDPLHTYFFVGGDDTHAAPSIAGNGFWVES